MNKIGFHLGIGGNAQGIKTDYMQTLDSLGVPAVIKSADNYGPVFELMELKKKSGVPHVGIFRYSAGGFDLPDYNKNPIVSAEEHWARIKNKLAQTPEFDKDVWLEVINEPDKNRIEWLAEFSLHIGKLMIAQGYKPALLSWSSGEPEPEQWKGQHMRSLLNWVSKQNGRAAIALHEYDYGRIGMKKTWPHFIGRYTHLLNVCDTIGIERVPILITEWGWSYNEIPEQNQALADIIEIGTILANEPSVLGAAIWVMAMGWRNIDNQVQKLIEPVAELAKSWGGQEIVIPVGNDKAREPYFREYWVLPQNYDIEKATAVFRDAFDRKITVGYSYDDAGIGDGLSSKKVVLFGIKKELEQTFVDWYNTHYPGVNIIEFRDSIDNSFSFSAWPTQYKYINQEFGVNPHIYNQYGLPGHEGVDIKAPHGSLIFSVADGIVSDTRSNENGHNYGRFVRIKHSGGYETTYAHLHKVMVENGQKVKAGGTIGLADNTGNSRGSHLHLTLKHNDAVIGGSTYIGYPHKIVDPTPFLAPLIGNGSATPPPPQGQGNAGFGVHTTATGSLAVGELELVKKIKPDVIKALSSMAPEQVSSLKNAVPDAKWIVRAFLDFGGRTVSARQFCDWTISDVKRTVERLSGTDYVIELHNEPNLTAEGLGSSWSSGADFAIWLIDVANIYKQEMPDAKFIYPGLSPGETIPGIRQGHKEFFEQSKSALQYLNGIGIHAYWAYDYPMERALDVVDWYIQKAGGRKIWVTEASNNKVLDGKKKGEEYVHFWRELKKRPSVQGVTYFVLSAFPGTFSNEIWITQNGTDLGISNIVKDR